MIEITHLPVRHGNVPLRFARGHFATNHSHINYYIDITYPKARLSEAQGVAKQLVSNFINNTLVDTILCLDGTTVIGTCLAEELTKSGFASINTHNTIYVVEPEYNSNSQMIFRDNIMPMIKGKTVVVVGGGNSAVADALILSRIAEKVILVHRRDQLRAEKVYHNALKEAENLEFRWNSTVSRLQHDGKVKGIVLKNIQSGNETELSCDAVFVSIGRKPNTALLEDQVNLDPQGYVEAGESCRTNIPGVFSVGDVRTKALRQIITAAADGAVAVHYAEEYLAGLQ